MRPWLSLSWCLGIWSSERCCSRSRRPSSRRRSDSQLGQLAELAEVLQRAAVPGGADCDAMTEPAKPAVAPAGIVKTPGIDDVIERVELALDAQDFRNEFLEGKELARDEGEKRYGELKALAKAVTV